MELITKAIIIAVVLFESILFIKYLQLRRGAYRLKGSGRVHDIEAVRNWMSFVRFLLFALPAISLFYYINHSFVSL